MELGGLHSRTEDLLLSAAIARIYHLPPLAIATPESGGRTLSSGRGTPVILIPGSSVHLTLSASIMSLSYLRGKLSLSSLFKRGGETDASEQPKPSLLRRMVRMPSKKLRKKSEQLASKLFHKSDAGADDESKRHASHFTRFLSWDRSDSSSPKPSYEVNELVGRGAVCGSAVIVNSRELEGALRHSQVWQPLSSDNSLAFFRVLHAAQLLCMKALADEVAEQNWRDFLFTWEEFQKASDIFSAVKENILYPTLDMLASKAVTAAKLTVSREKEKKLAAAIVEEYRSTRAVSSNTFDEWMRACLAQIESEERVVMPLESKLGKSSAERCSKVCSDVITPVLVQSKSEFGWCLGWSVMVISQSPVTGVSALALLGTITQSIQQVCSPSQYSYLQDRIKFNVAPDHWLQLVKTARADLPGKQKEPQTLQKSPLKDDPRFQPFVRMVKIGLPVEAVATKMSLSQVVGSVDEALAILSLDPDKPLPDKLEINKKSGATTANQAPPALQGGPLTFNKTIHTAIRLSVSVLSKLLNEKNMKDFGFLWEELQKAISLHSEMEENIVFPALDKVSNKSIAASKASIEHENEKRAGASVSSELRNSKTVTVSTFENWRTLCLAHLDREEEVFRAIEERVGKTASDRASFVYQEIMSPIFVQSKSEFLWLLGWLAMVISENSADNKAVILAVGELVLSLQASCSPPQFSSIKEKLKGCVSSSDWSKLLKDFKADQPGAQTGKVEPIATPVKEDARFANYFKMMKVGLPLDAAAIRMSNDRVVGSYEEAVDILSLDPNKPLPEKFSRDGAPVPRKSLGKQASAKSLNSDNVSALGFVKVIHDALRIVVQYLQKCVETKNNKDFGFTWEELQKAFNLTIEWEEKVIFSAFFKSLGKAAYAADPFVDVPKLKSLGDTLTAELKKSKTIDTGAFDSWRKLSLSFLDGAEKIIVPTETKLGNTGDERALAVYSDIITPLFVQYRNEFAWSIGWISMMICEYCQDSKTTADSLGLLINSLQSVCSTSEYALLKAKIKGSVPSQQWSKLAKDFNADMPGQQSEPEYQQPPIKDDPRFQKYFKMIKVGMPQEAAANQMVRERAADDYALAMRILALDPNKPFPDSL